MNEIEGSVREVVDDQDLPTLCPFCGSSAVCLGMHEWYAHSLEPHDLMNAAILSEHQCRNEEECGHSFWTAGRAL